MKVNYSLSLKLTLAVVLLSTIIVVSLSYINFQDLSNMESKIGAKKSKDAAESFAKSHLVLKLLDEYIDSPEKIDNISGLYTHILNLSQRYDEVLRIDISIQNKTTSEYTIYASSDLNYLGRKSSERNINSSINETTYYIVDEDNPIFTIISPIILDYPDGTNETDKIVGSYEIVFSMELSSTYQEDALKYIVLIGCISIFILTFSLLFLLRRTIVKPIMTFRDITRLIGKGELDAKVEIKSNDELGELAGSINEMAKDLKESRDKIEEYNRILEGLLNQKDEFIGQLGHDLKNPLTPLVGLIPIIIEKEQNPEIKEHLELIYHNVEYMKDLIFNTLKLAKLRSSNIEFDIEELNLGEEVKKVIESQKLLLRENNIDLENRIPDNIYVQADKLRLSEIFNNLISNSVKYTPEGGGKIIINAIKENTGFAVIGIKDTGIGMTQEQQDRVFDEFYKADKFSSEVKSSGLGLAICKRIVEKHGGKIWAKSMGPNMGSTFYFTLKLVNER